MESVRCLFSLELFGLQGCVFFMGLSYILFTKVIIKHMQVCLTHVK